MIFSVPNHKAFDEADMYPYSSYTSSSAASSVDCTLSLGTPSTRLSSSEREKRGGSHKRSSFCWDILAPTAPPPPSHKTSYGGSNKSGGGGDPLLLARRCANCDTTSTPLWRNGPRGPKSLCNACGIRFKKEERRATATANATPSGVMEPPSWGTHDHYQHQSPAIAGEFMFLDRPSLVHDYFTG